MEQHLGKRKLRGPVYIPQSKEIETLKKKKGEDICDVRRWTLDRHVGPVLDIRFTFDERFLMSAGKDKSVHLWNPHKGSHIKTYKGRHGYPVESICIEQDNASFYSAGKDRMIFQWDISTGEIIRRFSSRDHQANALKAIELNKQGTVLASGGEDRCLKLWDLKSRRSFDPIQKIGMEEFKGTITDIRFSENQVIASCTDGYIRSFDVRFGKISIDQIEDPKSGGITGIDISHDGLLLAATCIKDNIFLFEQKTGERLNKFQSHKHESYMLNSCFSPRDNYLYACSEDRRVYIYDIVSGRVLSKLGPMKGIVVCVRAIDGMIATATSKELVIWS